jgi:hypothetical protein
MIALAECQPDAVQLSQEWHNITGDSFIVDVTPISQEDPASGFVEVFKYAVKFSEQEPADTVHAWVTLASKRLIGSAGLFRGVEVPESLLDDSEGLEDLPYVSMFYRYLRGAGYSLESTFRSPGGESKPKREPRVRLVDLELDSRVETIRRLSAELHEKREGEKARLAAFYERMGVS